MTEVVVPLWLFQKKFGSQKRKTKMKKLVILFTLILFIISCGEKVREEILERYDNGKKKDIIYFTGRNNNIKIVKQIFYYENGQIEIKANFKDGKQDGKLTSYHENGWLKQEGTFKDGKQDGKSIFYNEDGSIRKEEMYKNGKENGKWVEYHKNRQIKQEGNFKEGKEEGKWVEYHENGQKQYEGTFKDGNLISKKRWNEDGSVKE